VSGPTTLLNPLKTGPAIVVASVGEAEGSRAAAAALACAAADLDLATLLIDVGGRAPRPSLLASAAAQKLEGRLERLAAHVPEAKAAARGQVCHLAVPADPQGLDGAAAAAGVAREATVVTHVPPAMLLEALDCGLCPSGVLLRADLTRDRPLLALAASELMGRGLAFAVLKRRLPWVAERRALFGALPAASPGSLPPRLLRQVGIRG
jgi:hypothetical protein